MDKIDRIRELKDLYINELYANVRKEQRTDQEYIDDTFAVPEVRSPHQPIRLGTGADIVDAPTEQIITSNPQVLVDVGNDEASIRVGKMINQIWIPMLKRANPNPFKESVKNKLARGESYIRLAHNESWVTGDLTRKGLPVYFVVNDPMVVYGSPEEDENGIPNKVIVFYQRQLKDLIVRYPHWTNPKKKGQDENKEKYVEWFEYWDSESRYFEADNEAVLNGGIQENLYGFAPFIRKYSGFGKRSPDGELSNLIVSDIRKNRDLIRNECAIASDIVSVLHLFSHRPKNIIIPVGTEVNPDQISELKFGAYALNVLNLPEGGKYENEEPPMPEPQFFGFLADLTNRIKQRNPFIMAGFPMGSSGRQQDMSNAAGMARYDTIVENTEHAWATAFEKALEICQKIPGLYPSELKKGDLDKYYKCTVKLKAEDPLEQDRKATLGSRLLAQNEIDPITNLVEFKGYAPERAMDIMVDNMAWKVILNSPDIAELIGLRAIEKAGMAEDIEYVKQRRMMLEQQQKGLQQQPSPSMMQRTQGEVQQPMGKEMIDMALSSRGQRKPPEAYNRGQ